MKIIESFEKIAFNSWSILIPIILVIFIVVLAIFSGLKRGIYGGLIILLFGLTGWIVGLFAAKPVVDIIVQNTKITLPDNKQVDAEILRKMFYGIVMFGIQALFLIVAEIISLILRKVIRKPLKNMRENKVSTVGSRSLGAILSTAGIVPCAILAANVTRFMTANNKVIEANNKMLSAISFKKAEGVSRYTPGLIASAKIGNDLLTSNNESNNNESVINAFEWYLQQFVRLENYILVSSDAQGNAKPILSANVLKNIHDKNEQQKVINGLIPFILGDNAKKKNAISLYFNFNTSSKSDALKYDKESGKTEILTDTSENAQSKLGNIDKINNIFKLYTATPESFKIVKYLSKLGLNDSQASQGFNEIYDLVNQTEPVWDILNAAQLKFNMHPDYKIQVYGKEYVSRMKDILFDLFEKNTYDKAKGTSKFIYDKGELNEEKMKEWVTIQTIHQKIYWIVSSVIDNMFIIPEDTSN
ncbi:CvpA family protein [Mycoplasmopsis agalactiae]|uniref:CvpA family protein n=1 Tax=Mycoplasmopsis agalactiae TaxID=2110 RepID=UPI001F1C0D50|nr:CvpA family protein [Mycoplasmopsis agalactiae]MCE6061468.1 CvpA family protein [Mycoplasmopsis agalactiae]